MEPNLFPASGDDRDRFKIFHEQYIWNLIEDEWETDKLIHDNEIIDRPLKPKTK